VTRYTRRQVVQGAGAVGLGLLAGCGRWPGQAQQPAPKVPLIGWLGSTTRGGPSANRDAFWQGMQELGYVEGQNVLVETRFAEGQGARLPELAAELLALPVDVIVTTGVGTAEAARDATSTIPIVIVYPGNPVAAGMVASLARPGANVTGVAQLLEQLGAKRLELLKETIPGLTRLAVLRDPHLPATPGPPLQAAAESLGVELVMLDVLDTSDLDAAFEAAARARADAVWLGGVRAATSLEFQSRTVGLAAQHQMPAIYGFKQYVEAGGLMSYAASSTGAFRRAASFVDKVLKGAKPADLPVEQPMLFDFAINLKTAQALGLTIPQHVLLQATEVIQ
jgi:putative tryptophan/tyrosine transport system substrate-binding protein